MLHGEVRLAPDKVCKVIVACAILHNICKARRIPEPVEDHDDGDGEDEDAHPPQWRDLAQSGLAYRSQFTHLHFQASKSSIYKEQSILDPIHTLHTDM